jgi:hypothetical protein
LAHAVVGGTLLDEFESLGLDVGGNDLSRASDSRAQCAWTKAAPQLKHRLASNERWLHEPGVAADLQAAANQADADAEPELKKAVRSLARDAAAAASLRLRRV